MINAKYDPYPSKNPVTHGIPEKISFGSGKVPGVNEVRPQYYTSLEVVVLSGGGHTDIVSVGDSVPGPTD